MALMNFPHWVNTQVQSQRHNAQQTNTDADSQYSTQLTTTPTADWFAPDSVY